MITFISFFENNIEQANYQPANNEWENLQIKKFNEIIPNNDTTIMVYHSQPEIQKNINIDDRLKVYQNMYKAATL